MPRYFFNVLDGADFFDESGVDLPDLAAAEREAVHAAGEIIRDDHFAGENWALTVMDEDHKAVLVLHFGTDGKPLKDLGQLH